VPICLQYRQFEVQQWTDYWLGELPNTLHRPTGHSMITAMANLGMARYCYTLFKNFYSAVSTFLASGKVDFFELDRKSLVVCAQCFFLLPSGLFTLCQQIASNLVTTILISEITNWLDLMLMFVDPCIIVQFINKNTRRCNNVSKFYYSIFIWSSTCFGQHTAHHQ